MPSINSKCSMRIDYLNLCFIKTTLQRCSCKIHLFLTAEANKMFILDENYFSKLITDHSSNRFNRTKGFCSNCMIVIISLLPLSLDSIEYYLRRYH